MLPKFPVKIVFDPREQEWWNHPETRTLVLLWRPTHIVSSTFWDEALRVGKNIEKRKPQTANALERCFWRYSENFVGDMAKFAEEALPFFHGEQTVTYVIEGE